MIFLAPIAGLIAGIAGALAVLVLYMLKLRRRPTTVSSTMLWKRAVKDMEGNVPWQKLSPSMLLLLHLLIVVLMALAIARPILDGALGDGQRVYLVVDTTASMNAIVDGRSGLERAKEQAIDRVRVLFDSGRSPMVSVIEAGREPRVLIQDSSQRGRLIGELRAIEPTDQPGELIDAIELIEALSEAHSQAQVADESEVDGTQPHDSVGMAQVWVYSDGGSIQSPSLPMRHGSGVLVSPYQDEVDLGIRLGNLAILAAGSTRDRSDPAMCRLFVRVGRNVDGPVAAVIRVYEGDQELASRAIVFEGDEQIGSESFELRLMRGARLRIELDLGQTGDALVVDNQAWVMVPDPQPVRITVVALDGQADPLLVDMLEVVARTSVAVVGVDDSVGDVDLVVFDRVNPRVLPDVPTIGFASVYPDQPMSDQLGLLGKRSRLISWDRADPMVRDASVGSISYARSVAFPRDEQSRVLASDRDGAVIVERAVGAHRHVRVGFALHDSNWAVQVGLPIFLVNAIEQLLPGANGLGEVYTTDQIITVNTATGVESIGPMLRAGLVEFNGQVIGVSLLDANESALHVRTELVIGSGDGDGDAGRSVGRGQRSLWKWFTLGAIVLIAFEWFAYAARVKIV